MFRFRLERVLQHRQRRLDARTLEAARAAGALQAARSALAVARRDLAISEQQAATARLGRLNGVELTRQLAWHENLAANVRHLEAVVAAAVQENEAAQERLRAAWRDREALQRLKERQHREWTQQEERRERLTLDEIGAIRAALSRRRAAAHSPTDQPRPAEGDRP